MSMKRFRQVRFSSVFKAREIAMEESWIHNHELEVIQKLKQELAHKEEALYEKIKKSITAAEQNVDAAGPEALGKGAIPGATGFSKREAAAEELYIRQKEAASRQ